MKPYLINVVDYAKKLSKQERFQEIDDLISQTYTEVSELIKNDKINTAEKLEEIKAIENTRTILLDMLK